MDQRASGRADIGIAGVTIGADFFFEQTTRPNGTKVIKLAVGDLSFKLGDFTLASGKKSDYYIDCRITTLHAEGGRLSGLVLYDLIREHIPQAEAVGGLTMGADPLVSNTASASAWALADHNEIIELSHTLELGDEDPGLAPTLIHGFLVRKAEKAHGTGRKIEGFLQPAARGHSDSVVWLRGGEEEVSDQDLQGTFPANESNSRR